MWTGAVVPGAVGYGDVVPGAVSSTGSAALFVNGRVLPNTPTG